MRYFVLFLCINKLDRKYMFWMGFFASILGEEKGQLLHSNQIVEVNALISNYFNHIVIFTFDIMTWNTEPQKTCPPTYALYLYFNIFVSF